jgi:hypothetical protein
MGKVTVTLEQGNAIWELIKSKYGVNEKDKKDAIYDTVIGGYRASSGDNQRIVSRAGFLYLFLAKIVDKKPPTIGETIRNDLARLAGFVDWTHFIEELSNKKVIQPSPSTSLKVGFLFGIPTVSLVNLLFRTNLKDSTLSFSNYDHNTELPIEAIQANSNPISTGSNLNGIGRYQGYIFPQHIFFQGLAHCEFLNSSELEKRLVDESFDAIISWDNSHSYAKYSLFPIMTISHSNISDVHLVKINHNSESFEQTTKWWLDLFPGSPIQNDRCLLIYEKDAPAEIIWERFLSSHAVETVQVDPWQMNSRQGFFADIDNKLSEIALIEKKSKLFLLIREPWISWLSSHIQEHHGNYSILTVPVSSLFPDERKISSVYQLFVREDRFKKPLFRKQMNDLLYEIRKSNTYINERIVTLSDAVKNPIIRELAFIYDMNVIGFAQNLRNINFKSSYSMEYLTIIESGLLWGEKATGD